MAVREKAAAAAVTLACALAAFAGEVKVLDDFEGDTIKWRGTFQGSIVSEFASHGRKAFKVVFVQGAQYPGIDAAAIDLDWAGFDALKLDVYNPQGRPVDLAIRIDDDRSTGYSSRYNGEFLIVNGQTRIEIPFTRLRAGDRALDVSKIRVFTIFMSSPERDTTLYFDNIRVVAGEEPPESAGREIAPAPSSALEDELREKASAAARRLEALIGVADARGLGTLEANIALVTARLGLDERPKLKWFENRKAELYDYVASSCEDACAALKAQLEGTRPVTPVPPVSSAAALARRGPHFVQKAALHAPMARQPVLLFSMLYHRQGPLCEYFTPINYFVHTHSFAGASRYDVERTPLYKAFHEYPDTHRVWNGDEGWCGHIVRDSASMGGGSEPVVVCLESPHTRQAIEEYIAKNADKWKGREEIHANILGGELSYICYCQYTLEMFRAYLEEKYSTIDRLNETWGTLFASFGEIDVMPNAAQADENRARWFDWQSFNCRRFVDHAKWAKSVIRRIDPEAPVSVGAVSYSLRSGFGRSGVDEEGLVREVDDVVLNESGASTITTDLLWSLSEGEKPMLDFEYHGDVAGILPHFLHGNAAMAMWWWPDRPDTEFPQFNRTALPFSWEIPLADVAECLKIALDVRRLGAVIAAFPGQPAEMAILYSRASMLQVDPEFLDLSDTPYTLQLKSVYAGMLGLDAPVRFISSRQVAEGKLASLKLLVVPAARYVFDDVAEAIFAFAEDGGTVVVTPDSLLFDEYARPRGHLARLGVRVSRSDEPRLTSGDLQRHEFLQEFQRAAIAGRLPTRRITAAAGGVPGAGEVLEGAGVFQVLEVSDKARVLGVYDDGSAALVEIPYGKGRFYYLATPLVPESFNRFMDAVAGSAGIRRPVTFTRADGRRDWNVEGRWLEGDGDTFFYVTNHAAEPVAVAVTLPFEAASVTDLRDPWRQVDLSSVAVGRGRTRIFAARKEAAERER